MLYSRAPSRLASWAVIDRYRAVVDGMTLRRMFNRATEMPRRPTRREFSIIKRVRPVGRVS
jgi:hypothetical protein